MVKEKNKSKLPELLKNDKDSLEKLKLAHEIINLKSEKRKFARETVLVIVVALMSTGITLGGTYIFKKWEFKKEEIQRANEEYKELKNDAAENKSNPELYAYYVCEFKNLENPENKKKIRDDILRYNQICENITKKNEAEKKVESNINDINQQLGELTKRSDELSTKVESNIATEKEKDELKKVNLDIDNTLKNDPEAAIVISSMDTITRKQEAIINESVKEGNDDVSKIAHRYPVKWFKEEYFLQFDDIRITLNELEKPDWIKVKICYTGQSDECQQIIESNQQVDIYETIDFHYDLKHYQLTLNEIGKAGKNPFKPAAYITLAVVKN